MDSEETGVVTGEELEAAVAASELSDDELDEALKNLNADVIREESEKLLEKVEAEMETNFGSSLDIALAAGCHSLYTRGNALKVSCLTLAHRPSAQAVQFVRQAMRGIGKNRVYVAYDERRDNLLLWGE